MRHRLVAAVACVLALGCTDLDSEPAPFCIDGVGCPEGTRCVDDVRCEVIPGAQLVPNGPRVGRRGSAPRLGGGGPGAQPDAGPVCVGGLTECRGQCVDVRTDPLNCGRCGVACAAGVECRLGVCCGVGFEICGDRCVDLQTDPDNCGVCDFPCILGLRCRLGTCQPPDTPTSPSADPGSPGLPGEDEPGFPDDGLPDDDFGGA